MRSTRVLSGVLTLGVVIAAALWSTWAHERPGEGARGDERPVREGSSDPLTVTASSLARELDTRDAVPLSVAGARRAALEVPVAGLPTTWLSGTLVDEAGAPLGGARVTARAGGTLARARTDDSGAFAVVGEALTPGTRVEVWVVASDDEWDEGRHLSRTVRAGAESAQWLVPRRNRVRWSVEGDVAMGGFLGQFSLRALRSGADCPAPLVFDGVAVVYDLAPGSYELVHEVYVGTRLATRPLARFDIRASERIELGKVPHAVEYDPRRVVLVLDGEPIPADTAVMVLAEVGDGETLRGRATVYVDSGGGVVIPVPRGVARVPELRFVVDSTDSPSRAGTIDGLRGGETVVLEPSGSSAPSAGR